ncbi:MAG: hypothetical protein AB7Q01_09065 [Gammaproteobacteria bacterium]
MRYQINAWLDKGDPHLCITDADSGVVRLQWIYQRGAHPEAECPEGPACAGCSALHCLINHLFLLACADKLADSCKTAPANEPEADAGSLVLHRRTASGRHPDG